MERPLTPPSFLDAITAQKHKNTPTRAAILGVLHFCRQRGFKATLPDIASSFNVSTRTIQRIEASHEARTTHNIPDSGPDPRGRRRKFTLQDAQGVTNFLEEQSFEGRQRSWKTIAFEAGYEVTDISERTIRDRMKELEYGNFISAQKRWLSEDTRRERVHFAVGYLQLRPNGTNWRDVIWTDEIHFGLGKQRKKNLKRKRGDRYNVNCIQEVGQIDHDEPLEKVIHGFAAVGYEYKRFFFYTTNNSNGKMSQHLYTNEILPTIETDLTSKHLTLFEDQDSSYYGKLATKWKDQHHIRWMLNAPRSPDLSVCETVTAPLKHYYEQTQVWGKKEARETIQWIWENKIDQEWINKLVDNYPVRLRTCIEVQGRMTKW
jgi:hypothetical protein